MHGNAGRRHCTPAIMAMRQFVSKWLEDRMDFAGMKHLREGGVPAYAIPFKASVRKVSLLALFVCWKSDRIFADDTSCTGAVLARARQAGA